MEKSHKKAAAAGSEIPAFLSALYNLPVDRTKSIEFDPKRPVASAAAVVRAIFFRPKSFYLDFNAEGPVREPALFVLLVSAVSGLLSVVVNSIIWAFFGVSDTNLLGVVALNLAFIVLSPVLVGVAAGVYLLSIRAFIGREGNFRQVYRILAYAYGAMILFWVPIVNALVFTYAAMVLMGLGIWSVYRTSFLTALITALAGFVPVSVGFIFVVAINGLVSG